MFGVCVCVCVCVCVFCLFTTFLSVLFVFHRKTSINRYMTFTSNFWKEKILWKKVNFWYQWIIQCNTNICCEHITGGVTTYLYGCITLLTSKCALCLCVLVSMCVISNQSTSKKPYVLDLSKHDALLHKTHSKVLLVLRYQGLT